MLLLFFLNFNRVSAQGFDHDYQKWGKTLNNFVVTVGSSTRFDYSDLKSNSKDFLEILESFSRVQKKEFHSWSSDQRLAFLINAYNIFTIKLIIDNYPVATIKKIGGLFTNPWKIQFISLLEEKISLDEIEHTLIRKQFKEPRIHFAVNCASISCPALNETPFKPQSLDAQLEAAALRFLNDSKQNYFDPKANTLWLSSIFKWYGSDFTENGITLEALSLKHMTLTAEQKATIKPGDTKIKYLDYDWNLNEKKK